LSAEPPHETGIDAAKLMQLEAVLAEAEAAARQGATRFCMGAGVARAQ